MGTPYIMVQMIFFQYNDIFYHFSVIKSTENVLTLTALHIFYVLPKKVTKLLGDTCVFTDKNKLR